MQHPPFGENSFGGSADTWQVTVEPWWLAGSEGQHASAQPLSWVDGEMQEGSTIMGSPDEQARAWAEIDLTLMLPGGAC